jgi:tetratricopeptide (TPR) repeat protein
MSIFSWFSKKSKDSKNLELKSVKHEYSNDNDKEGQCVKEISKKSTIIKNEKGYLESVKYVTAYIENNELSFQSYISLMKKVIPYMVKAEEFDKKDFVQIVNKNISRFSESESLQGAYELGCLYGKFDLKLGIDYFEKCASILPPAQEGKPEHFEIYVKLCEYYLDADNGNEALTNIRKAYLVNSNFNERFYWLKNHRQITMLQVRLNAEGYAKPKWQEVIYYTSCQIVLEELHDLVHDADVFFRIKGRCKDNSRYLFENHSHFKTALNSLNLGEDVDSFFQAFNEYVFVKMPTIIGITEPNWKNGSLQDFHAARSYAKATTPNFDEDYWDIRKFYREKHEPSQTMNESPIFIDITILFDDVKLIIRNTLIEHK